MKKVVRPWGDFKQFALNEKCSVKVLEIDKNESTSLQKHKNRRESWYFLTDGWVQVGEKIWKAKKGETIKIGKLKKHRIFSKGGEIKVLEISYGDFSENDEVRLEDKYGRE